ncbi:hypothetical protein cypCar_00008672, partial [Cyprinus carpio]
MSLSAPLFKEKWMTLFLQAVLSEIDVPVLIPVKEELRELREQPTDPQEEQEIIDRIEEVYFSSDSFDMVQYELEKLPPDLNLLELEEYRDKLKRQQAA